MIKKTLYFGNPCYLSIKEEQLVVLLKDTGEERTLPLEDIGYIEIDHPQITFTSTLMRRCMEENVILVICDASHHPVGLTSALYSHSTHAEQLGIQISASRPAQKRLWQQVIRAKIRNQHSALVRCGLPGKGLDELAKTVRSGDTGNREARASRLYWQTLFSPTPPPAGRGPGGGHKPHPERPRKSPGAFRRDRYGDYPNNLLNYGYAVLRAITARAIITSGMHPAIGLFHKNRYNAFALADDMMEPYRPYVDLIAHSFWATELEPEALTPEIKRRFLVLPVQDVILQNLRRPLMVAVQWSCASLVRCLSGEDTELALPDLTLETNPPECRDG